MKCTFVILSLLFLGVCSGKIIQQRNGELIDLDNLQDTRQTEQKNNMDEPDFDIRKMYSMKEKSDRSMVSESKTTESMKRDDTDAMNNMKPEKAITTFTQIKDFVSRKYNELVSTLSRKFNNDEATVYSHDVPSFADPLEVGNVVDKLALATVQYKNVIFHGMCNAHQIRYRVNTQTKQAVITILLKDVYFDGQYTISNLLRHASGNFHVKLTGNVAYVHTVSYEYEKDELNISASNGQLQYDNSNSHYENIGFFAQLFQGRLGRILLQTITTKIEEEVKLKLASQIQRQVEDVNKNLYRVQVVSALQSGIKKAYSELQAELANTEHANIQMECKNQEEHTFQNKKYHAKILSVNLLGIEKLNLSNVHATHTDTKVNIDVQLQLQNATASTAISYQKIKSDPHKSVNVLYTVPSIQASFVLEKELHENAPLQLLKFNVKTSEVKLSESQGHDNEELLHDIFKQIASRLQTYLDKSLENFLQNEVSAILTKGANDEYKYSMSYRMYSPPLEQRM